ncbi:GspH/FimT family protein [Pseudoalteromonas aurantia]|uniref:Type II secretion system protein H n=1 Tax=Pseudoalteromonas aurantia 208 TaxID=1314867 RepID=A0ABR9E909_9GAMM|nr:GspH/FimT family protein [Pseudoalteromonas aurantia]MBE0367282.1 type IV fimbrial biogenesis protein FimT [Pseudoalteromonas aurantia 208]
MDTLKRQNSYAFTMIEMLITVAIMSILSLLSLASYSEILSNHLPEQHLRLVKKTLTFARSQAMVLDKNITICPLINNKCQPKQWHKPLTVFIDNQDLRIFGQNDKRLIIIDAIKHPHNFTYPRRAIVFKPNGSIKGFTNGTFVYCIERKSGKQVGLELTLSLAGRSRLRATDKCK